MCAWGLFISRASVWTALAHVLWQRLLFLHLESHLFVSHPLIWGHSLETTGCAVIPCLFPSAQSAPLMKLAQIILFLPFYPGTKTLLSTALREAGEGHGMSLPNADSLKAES